MHIKTLPQKVYQPDTKVVDKKGENNYFLSGMEKADKEKAGAILHLGAEARARGAKKGNTTEQKWFQCPHCPTQICGSTPEAGRRALERHIQERHDTKSGIAIYIRAHPSGKWWGGTWV